MSEKISRAGYKWNIFDCATIVTTATIRTMTAIPLLPPNNNTNFVFILNTTATV